jgi:hypothetical protein
MHTPGFRSVEHQTSRPRGLEPPTYGLGVHCSIQLSYGRIRFPSPRRGLNPRPRPYQGRALPLSYKGASLPNFIIVADGEDDGKTDSDKARLPRGGVRAPEAACTSTAAGVRSVVAQKPREPSLWKKRNPKWDRGDEERGSQLAAQAHVLRHDERRPSSRRGFYPYSAAGPTHASRFVLSGRRVSNPQHPAWKASALPIELLPPAGSLILVWEAMYPGVTADYDLT